MRSTLQIPPPFKTRLLISLRFSSKSKRNSDVCERSGANLRGRHLLRRGLEWLHEHVCLGGERKPSWLHSSIIHPPFGAAHVSRDGRQPTQTAAWRSRPRSQSAGGSDGCEWQPTQTGGRLERVGKRTLLRFSLWRLQFSEAAAGTLESGHYFSPISFWNGNGEVLASVFDIICKV